MAIGERQPGDVEVQVVKDVGEIINMLELKNGVIPPAVDKFFADLYVENLAGKKRAYASRILVDGKLKVVTEHYTAEEATALKAQVESIIAAN